MTESLLVFIVIILGVSFLQLYSAHQSLEMAQKLAQEALDNAKRWRQDLEEIQNMLERAKK